MFSAVSLSGIDRNTVIEDYERRKLELLSDVALLDLATDALSVPLAEDGPVSSFVLHAPLELLARAALLPYVAPSWHRTARVRIVSLVAAYEAAGERLSMKAPIPETGQDLLAARMRKALAGGDLAELDRAAPVLGRGCSTSELSSLLADQVLDRLSAAGHANIYFELARAVPGSSGARLVWPISRELAKSPGHSMRLEGASRRGEMGILDALAQQRIVGPPERGGIAPMVERAQDEGVIAELWEASGQVLSREPTQTARLLQRSAALTMLEGPEQYAPYGWTHCLTLVQAALEQGPYVADPVRAARVAATYLVAHWSCLGKDAFDPSWSPEPPRVALEEALDAQPSVASAAVWHADASQQAYITQALATRAASAHDAHHVKYTLACLRAATADPGARPLFLAAAAYLGSWWTNKRDASDPLSGQAIGSGGTEPATSPAVAS